MTPHSFAVQAQQAAHQPPTPEEIENEAFNQNKVEAFGLQLKEKHGTITPGEQEKLGVLQAKMNDFRAQRLEGASRFEHNFANVPVHAPGQPVSAPVQPRLAMQRYRADVPLPSLPPAIAPTLVRNRAIQAKGDTTGDRPDLSVEQRPNETGMPDALKAGVESLSGYALDEVRVHYNSPKPAQLQALAYTQGTEIHVASGQEEHLPHEAWHVVQQAQGRVKPTLQMKDGVSVNADAGLEHEADVMGAKALAIAAQRRGNHENAQGSIGALQQMSAQVVQFKPPADLNIFTYTDRNGIVWFRDSNTNRWYRPGPAQRDKIFWTAEDAAVDEDTEEISAEEDSLESSANVNERAQQDDSRYQEKLRAIARPTTAPKPLGPESELLRDRIYAQSEALKEHDRALRGETGPVHGRSRHGFQTGWEGQRRRADGKLTPDQPTDPMGTGMSIKKWKTTKGVKMIQAPTDVTGNKIREGTPVSKSDYKEAKAKMPSKPRKSGGPYAGSFFSPEHQNRLVAQALVVAEDFKDWVEAE
ncbi:MAG TPA: DUF4157 domain-containing protein, partial [Coleofasciculaceae cyanobacterium]